MVSHVNITLRCDALEKDLALPVDVFAGVLAPAVAQALRMPSTSEYRFALCDGKKQTLLPAEKTLMQSLVMDGDILELKCGLGRATSVPVSGTTLIFVLPPLGLVDEEGNALVLNEHVTRIGRRSPNNVVDIDLSPYDNERLISRNHAEIVFDTRQQVYTITDLQSYNGTLLNGKIIPARQPQRLSDGDQLTFGSERGVKFVFCNRQA
jgi:hypothetical protein